jgi:hypothetical protein
MQWLIALGYIYTWLSAMTEYFRQLVILIQRPSLRYVRMIWSRSRQKISAISITYNIFVTDEGFASRCELDSHADTCVADGQTCDVMPYTESYIRGPKYVKPT